MNLPSFGKMSALTALWLILIEFVKMN